MKPRIRIAVASLGLMGAFAAAPLALAGQAHEESLPEAVHRGGLVDRTIVIDGTTKWINVTEGETIRFLVGGKSFAWVFDSYDQGADLKKLAPKGMLGDRPVKVYVAADPRGRI
jgi:hypothetical protein